MSLQPFVMYLLEDMMKNPAVTTQNILYFSKRKSLLANHEKECKERIKTQIKHETIAKRGAKSGNATCVKRGKTCNMQWESM